MCGRPAVAGYSVAVSNSSGVTFYSVQMRISSKVLVVDQPGLLNDAVFMLKPLRVAKKPSSAQCGDHSSAELSNASDGAADIPPPAVGAC